MKAFGNIEELRKHLLESFCNSDWNVPPKLREFPEEDEAICICNIDEHGCGFTLFNGLKDLKALTGVALSRKQAEWLRDKLTEIYPPELGDGW